MKHFCIGLAFFAALPTAVAQGPPVGGTLLRTIPDFDDAWLESGFASSACVLGDLNSDGHPDFAVGSPGSDRVWVVSGRNAAPLYVLRNYQPGSDFGVNLAAIGDLDRDGVTELAVAATRFDQPGARDNGKVYVYSGSSGRLLRSAVGDGRFDFFGQRLAAAGDVNADGVPDVIVGASERGRSGRRQGPGYVVVLSGANGTELHRFTGTDQRPIEADGLAGLGDVNGDGFDDVAISVGYASLPGEHENGRVEVRSGLDGSILYKIHGNDEDELGTTLASVEDVDGDGVRDFLVSGLHGRRGPDYWYAWLHSGATGERLRTHRGDWNEDSVGETLGAAGDVNGDGVQDYFVGEPRSSRRSGHTGRLWIYSGDTGEPIQLLESPVGRHLWFGRSVAALGDTNHDGFDDLLIGAPLWSHASDPQRPQVLIYSGGPPAPGRWTARPIATLPAPSLVRVADFDADSDSDVLIGSLESGALDWLESDGGFLPEFTVHAIAGGLGGVRDAEVADVDGDGDGDVVAALGGPPRIAWFENLGGSPPAWQQHPVLPLPSAATALQVGDLNADGAIDAAVGLASGAAVIWLENQPGPPRSWVARAITTQHSLAAHLDMGDFNGDGRLDVLAAFWDGGDGVVWFENDGANPPNWSEAVPPAPGGSARATAFQAADFNGDGRHEVLAGWDQPVPYGGSWIWRLRPRRNDSYSWLVEFVEPRIKVVREFALGDWDGDGDLDFACAASGDDSLTWCENVPGNGIEWEYRPLADRIAGAASLAAGDFTGNGAPDLVSAAEGADTVYLHRNRLRAPEIGDATPGRADAVNTLPVAGGTPSGEVLVAWSTSTGATAVVGCPAGARFDLQSPRLAGLLATDALGEASLTGAITAAASGKTVYFQAVDLTTCEVGTLRAHRFP